MLRSREKSPALSSMKVSTALPRRRKRYEPVEAAARKGMGAAIQMRRKRKQLSQAALAERVGLSVGWLSQIESGAVEVRWGSLRRIADALGLSLPELIEESERMEPSPHSTNPRWKP